VRYDVKVLSRFSSGVFLSFFTDSPDISIRLRVSDASPMIHMPATGMAGAELFIRTLGRWHPAAVAKPDPAEVHFQRPLLEGASPLMRECRIYLPLYKQTEEVALGIRAGFEVRPAPVPIGQRPIVFYGTSITQGGCANTAGSDYVSTVGRLLDAEVLNLGFSGNGRGEPEVGKLIREVNARLFVLDFLANVEEGTLAKTLHSFIEVLREKSPTTPIVIMSCPAFDQTLWNPRRRDEADRKRDIAMRIYLDLKSTGDARLFFIDGNGLLPAGLSGAFVDGTHPTSHGFAIMAERLLPQLQAILAEG
jgi:lysophospholipase L1-like esterase